LGHLKQARAEEAAAKPVKTDKVGEKKGMSNSAR